MGNLTENLNLGKLFPSPLQYLVRVPKYLPEQNKQVPGAYLPEIPTPTAFHTGFKQVY